MDFFSHQERARRKTGLMVLLFFLAVILIVLAINLAGALIFLYFSAGEHIPSAAQLAAVPRSAYVMTTLVVLGVIAFGSISRLYELAAGGAAVAQMAGGRWVGRNSQEPLERRLLNIIEEMAIASGIAVPQAWVIDDTDGINAFAAGFSPNEAVIAVTSGALRQLSRDELQGVIAHEFSHILNGDMRLNIRLMGVIAGIVMIGALGSGIMRYTQGDDDSRVNGESKKDKDGGLPVFIVFIAGLALWLIGSIGVLFGRLIKAAISREREFLADASAVQFTRNPEGIGGALYKIGAHGGFVSQRRSEELSHMYIAQPLAAFLNLDWFATHPPIDERVSRLMGPSAKLIFRDRAKRAEAAAALAGDGPRAEDGATAEGNPMVSELASPFAAASQSTGEGAAMALPDKPPPGWGRSGADFVNTTPAKIIASVGQLTSDHVDAARSLLEQMPAEMRSAAALPAGARAVIAALLLGEGEVLVRQVVMLHAVMDEGAIAQARQFALQWPALDPRLRVPLIELALPSLRSLPEMERDACLKMLEQLARADGRITVRRFVLLTLCRRALGRQHRGPMPVKHNTPGAVASEVAIVLSLLAHSGQDAPGVKAAFDKGMAAAGIGGGVLRELRELTIFLVEGALYELKLLAPLKKPIVIKACLETVMADGRLTVAEGELMRAICAALDSPLPPILESKEPDL